MGKYWAVEVVAKMSVVISGILFIAGVLWFAVTLITIVNVVTPLAIGSMGPFAVVLGASALIGNALITFVLWFGALIWFASGQMLRMMLEVTENSRHLKHLKALPLVLRQPDPPWLKDPDEAWSRRA